MHKNSIRQFAHSFRQMPINEGQGETTSGDGDSINCLLEILSFWVAKRTTLHILKAFFRKKNRPRFLRTSQQAEAAGTGLIAGDSLNCFCHPVCSRRKVDDDFTVQAPLRFVADEESSFMSAVAGGVFCQKNFLDVRQGFSCQHCISEITSKPAVHLPSCSRNTKSFYVVNCTQVAGELRHLIVVRRSYNHTVFKATAVI